MKVHVKKDNEIKFFDIMIHERIGDSFTGLRDNYYIISDRDYHLVKHLCDKIEGNET